MLLSLSLAVLNMMQRSLIARTMLPLLLGLMLSGPPLLAADAYDQHWGPALGQPLPQLDAADQAGDAQTFSTLKGKKGLLLFMNRSADW